VLLWNSLLERGKLFRVMQQFSLGGRPYGVWGRSPAGAGPMDFSGRRGRWPNREEEIELRDIIRSLKGLYDKKFFQSSDPQPLEA